MIVTNIESPLLNRMRDESLRISLQPVISEASRDHRPCCFDIIQLISDFIANIDPICAENSAEYSNKKVKGMRGQEDLKFESPLLIPFEKVLETPVYDLFKRKNKVSISQTSTVSTIDSAPEVIKVLKYSGN